MRIRLALLAAVLSATAFSATLSAQDLQQAENLYKHTDYDGALRELSAIKSPGAEVYALMGKSSLMKGDLKKATGYLEKAVALEPGNASYVLWLGRSWGRRAEASNPLFAAGDASRARDFFEKAVALDPKNGDALGDLFDYYLDAPGFLGGGTEKAEAIARRVAELDPPEGHFLFSRLAEKRKELDKAEQELRAAVKLGPSKAGHVIALARFLAKQGRTEESEATLARAEDITPNNPRLLFGRASIYVETHRKPAEARKLLEKYLQCDLTPNDPPRSAAEKLLKQVAG